ncbi:putative phosphatidylinositol/phosphatidylcholine transfer protein SFH3-like [Capsicum annuum]|uniref:Endoplasmic reticulum transmembrane protein n=1 Tax=Capsicum annuum TaxID=4072 RepID=A0A2G2YK98_CAPAN|nr:uncharacterized protein LOC107844894 isoform X2 [Capsicum annuum]KAF3630448.1 putative phosphatidylinositol/phosphatidylcholine transfer protein SFH3-like [Capsicum annuum]KAF3646826.1 putative phosphatidylinositol/phosphatidylcholine transfer protein SFH3-like [Capsicum annuum]PHT70172.1 hypothetical protein T459_25276 [Capsicum annuum]
MTMMIQPLFALVFLKVVVILTLIFKTPLRKPILMALDRSKQGRGPVIFKSTGGTLFVVLVSILFNVTLLQNRATDSGTVNPTDQVLFATQLLEASLLGFSLFLALVIDRLHYYIKELRVLRKTLEGEKKTNQIREVENIASKSPRKSS